MPFTFRSEGTRLGGEPAADLTGKEYFVGVLQNADGKIALAGANPGAGVLQGIIVGEDKAGGEVGLQIDGIHYAILGASVTRGDRLNANSSGQLVGATTGQTSFFRALETITVGAGAPAGQVVCAVVIGNPTLIP